MSAIPENRHGLLWAAVAFGVGVAMAAAPQQAALQPAAAEDEPADMLEPLAKPGQPVAPEPQAPDVLTIVGRRNKVVVKEPGGQMYEIGPQKLTFLNQPSTPLRVSLDRATRDNVPGAEPGHEMEEPTAPERPEKTEKLPENDPESGGLRLRPDKSEQEASAEKQALKAQQIEKLRQLQLQGAWFYTHDDQPVSSEDLARRLESGDIEGIKTIDIYQQPWQVEKLDATEPLGPRKGTVPDPSSSRSAATDRR